jgi:two-component system, NtrC family, sensor kinase
MPRYRPSLIVSIMAFLGFMLVLTWLLFSLLAFKTAANDLYAQKGEHTRTLLATFVSQLPESIPSYPEAIIPPDSSASIYVQKLADDPAFIRLTLLDRNGKPIFSAGREGNDVYLPFAGLAVAAEGSFVRPDGSGITQVISVMRNGAPVGRAGLVLSLTSEKNRLSRTRQMLIAYFALDFILLLGLGSYILSRIIVNPINRLLAATQKITGGQYGQWLHVSGSAELAGLADSFNEMSAALLNKDRQVSEQVAALKNANSELRQAREETLRSEKMASVGLLAAGMAHEVGTPLASIMGYAELLTGEEPDNAAIQDYARRISQDCARIDRIVRGLLDYSHPHGREVEPVDIRRVVLESIELLSQQGAFKRIEVSTFFDDLLSPALADPHQLQQVLINLMLNGRDAMPDGGTLAVRVKNDVEGLSGRPEGCVRIDVLDSGSGIPAEHLGRLFDPFFTTKPPGKGTGLGLAIAARIIEGCGGRIAVQSTVGTGSCFSVWLQAADTNGADQ